MASITIDARIGDKVGTVTIETDHLNWVAMDAGESIERDALPTEFLSIIVGTERGCSRWPAPGVVSSAILTEWGGTDDR